MYTKPEQDETLPPLPVRWIVANIFNRPLHSTESPFPCSCALWTATYFQELNALVLLTYLATVSFLIHVVPTCLPTSGRHFCFSMPLGVHVRDGARRRNFTFRNVSTSIFPPGSTTHSVNRTTVLVRRKNKIRGSRSKLAYFVTSTWHFATNALRRCRRRERSALPPGEGGRMLRVFCGISVRRDLRLLLEI